MDYCSQRRVPRRSCYPRAEMLTRRSSQVTEYKDIIRAQHEENDRQFEVICDTMPQLVSVAIIVVDVTSTDGET